MPGQHLHRAPVAFTQVRSRRPARALRRLARSAASCSLVRLCDSGEATLCLWGGPFQPRPRKGMLPEMQTKRRGLPAPLPAQTEQRVVLDRTLAYIITHNLDLHSCRGRVHRLARKPINRAAHSQGERQFAPKSGREVMIRELLRRSSPNDQRLLPITAVPKNAAEVEHCQVIIRIECERIFVGID